MKYTFHEKILIRIPSHPLKNSFSLKELKALFNEPKIQEYIYLASPDLLTECLKWLNNKFKGSDEKLIISLLKYALRFHSRPTPFGLFSGCAVANWESTFTIDGIHRRRTRLDMDFLNSLSTHLSENQEILKKLKFTPNTSLYKIHQSVRYIEYYYNETGRHHQISSVEHNEYLDEILKKAKDGCTIFELAKAISNEDVSLEEATSYIEDLIKSQILISELFPSVLGENYLNRVIDFVTPIVTCNKSHPLENYLNQLKMLKLNLEELDHRDYNTQEDYSFLINCIKELDTPFKANRLFQTDLYFKLKPDQDIDSQVIKDSLLNAVGVLIKISNKYENTRLNAFKELFVKRYGDSEIPLLQLLDTESGIGYGSNPSGSGDNSNLINDIPFSSNESTLKLPRWSEAQALLLKKITHAKINNQNIINLAPDDVKTIEGDWSELPATFSLVFSNLGRKNGKNLLYIKSVGNPSAVNLIARFGTGNEDISKLINDIVQWEKSYDSDVILAEVTHLPEGRTGNILLRPVFREYEIPYLTNSLTKSENLLRPDDLLVGVSHNEIYLKSKRLNKRVVPRNSNAHNYHYKPLPIYQFLCDLQFENKRPGLSIDFGFLFEEFDFIPRICIDNVIISLATWTISITDMDGLIDHPYLSNTSDKVQQTKFVFALNNWRTRNKLPSVVLFPDGENDILIDLNNIVSFKLLLSFIKFGGKFRIKEFISSNEHSFIKNGELEIYNNEIIATLLSNEKVEDRPSLPNSTAPDQEFPIGSEWLYYKFYCGRRIAETFLIEAIHPLADELIENKMIDKWFFIKYNDPDFHIRVRFHITDISSLGWIISKMASVIRLYTEDKLIWKVQNETYIRETNRYGGISLDVIETMFFYDSLSAITIIKDTSFNNHWLFTLKSIDLLLNDFHCSLAMKMDLMNNLKESFNKEFNPSKYRKIAIDRKYRLNRNIISEILEDNSIWRENNVSIYEDLLLRSKNNKNQIDQLMDYNAKGLLTNEIPDIICSLIHMLVNRVIRNNPRKHELLIYDFLFRYYLSRMKRDQKL